jgi:outer membrane protein assembly factor BamB
MKWIVPPAVLMALLAAFIVPASAEGARGDVFVVDVGYGGVPGQVIKINPSTHAQTRIARGDGVSTLVNPVGIAVDSDGTVLVADSDGYGMDDSAGHCQNGCGAIIRVNPVKNGHETVESKLQHFVNPYGLLVARDGHIFVTDSADGAVFKIDPSQPATNNQTRVFDGTGLSMFHPWAIARDPRSNRDLLVTDTAAPFDSSNLADPVNYDGRVVRLHHGAVSRVYKGGFLAEPREVVVTSSGAIYVADALAFDGNGGIIKIDPRTGTQTPITSGPPLVTTSGVTFNYRGTRLLIADQSAFGTSGGACAEPGCGGVIQANPDGGRLSSFSRRGSLGAFYEDPTGVTVDRRSPGLDIAPPPGDPPIHTLPLFNSGKTRARLKARTVPPVGIVRYPITGLRYNTVAKLTCLGGGCNNASQQKNSKERTRVTFYFSDQNPLEGRFRIVIRKRHFVGRYKDYRWASSDPANVTVLGSGCLEPGAAQVIRSGSNKTTVTCPPD